MKINLYHIPVIGTNINNTVPTNFFFFEVVGEETTN
jgi:hypothetical protein